MRGNCFVGIGGNSMVKSVMVMAVIAAMAGGRGTAMQSRDVFASDASAVVCNPWPSCSHTFYFDWMRRNAVGQKHEMFCSEIISQAKTLRDELSQVQEAFWEEWLAAVSARLKKADDIDRELSEISMQQSSSWLIQMQDLMLDVSLLGVHQSVHALDTRRGVSSLSASTSSSSPPPRLQDIRREELLNKSWELQRLGSSGSTSQSAPLQVRRMIPPRVGGDSRYTENLLQNFQSLCSAFRVRWYANSYLLLQVEQRSECLLRELLDVWLSTGAIEHTLCPVSGKRDCILRCSRYCNAKIEVGVV
eukprot:765473-Hanusia_phi.AAC.1